MSTHDKSTAIVWCYAEDEDSEQWRGHCATREIAISEGASEIAFDGGSVFYVAPFETAKAAKFMPKAEYILELASDNAYDVGPLDMDPLEASKEAEAELNAFLEAWATKHVEVSFYEPVGRPERINVPTSSEAP